MLAHAARGDTVGVGGDVMIKGIQFVTIPVSDQTRALAFYTEKLGFTTATNQPMGPSGQRWIELKIPGAETRVTLFTPPGHEDRVGTFVPLSFWADDVEGAYETLRSRGERNRRRRLVALRRRCTRVHRRRV